MAELVFRLKGRELKRFVLSEKRTIIGRTPGCDVMIDNIAVSREHAKIDFSNGQYILTDLGSSNGTFLNGTRVNKTTLLNPEDLIQIGKFELLFEDAIPDEFILEDSGAVDKTMIMTPEQRQATSSQPEKVAWRKITVVSGKANRNEILLKKDLTTIGKGSGCDLVISGFFLSKVQATIRKRGNKYYLRNKGSMLSTQLNGQKIQGDTLLNEGDSIQIRKTQLYFC